MPPAKHSILGASGAERWLHCTPSASLTAQMAEEESTYAAEGTAAHALCEWKVRRALKQRAGKRPASDYWTDEMEEFTDDYRDYVMDLVGQAKQKCKDPITMVEQHLDFSCWVPDGFGTGDFLLVADGELNVVDFKYGIEASASSDSTVNAPVSRYSMRTKDGRELSNSLNVIFIELPKALGLEDTIDTNSSLENWAIFLKEADNRLPLREANEFPLRGNSRWQTDLRACA